MYRKLFRSGRTPIWYVSPITLRILVVNISALVILALGLLYTGQYEREMIRSQLDSLLSEGRLLSAALAQGGVRETLTGDPVLTEDLSRHMLRKLAENDSFRTILFSKTGQLLLDSHQLLGPGGVVQIVELDTPFSTWSFEKKLSYYLQKGLKLLPTRLVLPFYPEKVEGIETYPNLIQTLSGESFANAWRDEDGKILLTASLPVQNLKNVLGAVMLMSSGDKIESAVRSVQLTVLQLFLWALLTTIVLSFYLSETIGSPILRLADAAEKVRQSLLLKDSIPNFSYRRDEIGILSIALREMTTALSDRMDAIGNFAADVAHEIKNPLASLKSAVETLMVVKDEERQKKLLAIIENDVDRLNRLITDISMVSRLDSEMNRAEKVLLDMTRLLQNIVDLESNSSGLKDKIALNVDGNKKLWVRGNDTQLAQVMHNLIQNAISFVTDQGKISITAQAQEAKIVIFVDNDGPAIPEKKLETIFQRFYSERPEKEKFGLHSGLGLNISRQIIRAHQGTIFARNLKTPKGEHQGVRFTIILPAGGAT